MNYLMEAWRIIYAMVVVLLCAVTMGIIFGIVLCVGLAIGWVFNLLMDGIFHGKPYDQQPEDTDEH